MPLDVAFENQGGGILQPTLTSQGSGLPARGQKLMHVQQVFSVCPGLSRCDGVHVMAAYGI